MTVAASALGAVTAFGQAREPSPADAMARLVPLVDAERFRAGGGDLVPLARYYLDASQAARDPGVSLALARLAVQAAPGDPHPHAVLLGQALRSFNLGEAAGELWAAVRAAAADRWFLSLAALYVPAVIALGALVSALALLVCLLPRHGSCFFHDFGDALPRHLRRYVPGALLVLAAAVALGGGLGPVTLGVALALALLPYPRSQERWALALCLAVGCGAWSSFDGLSRLGGTVGQRAWAYYRAQNGDSGPGLDADLAARFGPRDVDGLLARSAVARRAGRYDHASELLVAAMRAGADEGGVRVELGNLFFLRGQLKDAEAEYARAAAAAPRSAVPWINLHVVYLRKIQLVEADKALENARSLDPVAVAEFQRNYKGGRGALVPVNVPVKADRVYTELVFDDGDRAEWPRLLAGGLFSSFAWLRPAYLSVLCVVVALLAGNARAGRHSHRCPSCGTVVCPRCGRRVKGSDTCSACWSLSNRQGTDSAERDRQRHRIAQWKTGTKKFARVIRWLVPGWSDFSLSGSVPGLVVGLVWGLAAGVVLADVVYPTPLFPGGDRSTWPAWAVLLLCHLHGARRSSAPLRARR